MDKKDVSVLQVAHKYVQDLRESERPELWRDYWKLEAKLLEQKRGK
jgi:hypothetical protein